MKIAIIGSAIFLNAIAASCSLPGEGDGGTSPHSGNVKPGEKDPVEDVTAIDFMSLDGGTSSNVQCYKEKDGSLPIVSSIIIDGLASDWNGTTPFISDTPEDHAWDVTDIYMGAQGRDLVAAFTGHFASSDSIINLRFGVIADNGETSLHVELRDFRIEQDKIFLKTAGQWKEIIDPDLATAKRGQDVVEVRLSSLLVGEVMAHDLWWVKPVFENPAGDNLDVVSIQYLLSPFQTAHRYALHQCWLSKDAPYVATHIVEEDLNEGEVNSAVAIYQKSFAVMLKIFGDQKSDLQQTTFLLTKKPVQLPETPYESVSFVERDVAVNVDQPALSSLSAGSFSERKIFAQILTKLGSLLVMSNGFEHEPLFADALAVVLTRKMIEQQMGIHFFITKLFDDAKAFLASPDPTAENASSSKSFSFGYLLSFTFDHAKLFNAWSEMRSDSAQTFRTALAEVSNDAETVDRMWRGWVELGEYDEKFAPGILSDTDGDGLPILIERKIGTDARKVDTNFDGWSDLTEAVYSDYHAKTMKEPRFISVDGIINEWIDLIPKRMLEDEDPSGSACGPEGDIDFFAGLAKPAKIAVGARTKKAGGNFIGWRLAVDFRDEKKSYVATTDDDGQGYTVTSKGKFVSQSRAPWKSAHGAGEFLITIDQLTPKTPHDFEKPENVTLKLETFVFDKGKKKFCDDTIWFKPAATI
jgi:hypothetical protein